MTSKMPQTSICRMCLVTDVRMFTITGTPLQAMYEKITEAELLENMKPVAACYICHAQLRRSLDFMQKAVKADEALTDFLINNKLTVKSVARIDRSLYKLHHPFTTKVEIHDNTLTEDDDEPKVKKETSFEFVADDHPDFEDHIDFLPLNEPEVQIDEKTLIEQPQAEYLEIQFMKEEKDLPVSDADDNRDDADNNRVDADSEDDRPLTKVKALKRKHQDDGDWKPPKKPPSEKKPKKAGRPQKRIKLVKKQKAEDQTEGTRKITFKRPYACRICQTKFLTESDLKAHKREHRPYVCDICQKRFRTNPLLKQHLSVHTGEKPFQCNECGTQFSRPHHLRNHLRTHTGEVPYECNVCNRRFNNSSNLRQHLKRHTGEKPFQCDICQRRFAQKNTLQKHLKTHAPGRSNDIQNTRERPYKCTECGAGFVRVYHLKRHVSTHSGEKPFRCHVCCRCFNRKSTLTTHLKTHSVVPKPYCFI